MSVLKSIACICVAIVAVVIAFKGDTINATFTVLFGLAIIFIPWHKWIEE